MSDTPRTDEFSGYINRDGNLNRDDRYPGAHQFILASFSRQLESELAAMTAERDRYREELNALDKALRCEGWPLEARLVRAEQLSEAILERDKLAFSWSGCATQLKDACEDLERLERDALLKGEFICKSCGLRKNASQQEMDFR